MLNKIIDKIRLPFRKEKELYLSLYQIIGIIPHNIEYYKTALLHKSITHRNSKRRPDNNERLEFLGDAILDAVVGDIVYEHFPKKKEGFLTNTRSKIVQRETLNMLARELKITDLILSSNNTSSHNSYLGGNAFEALVGALYLDHGYKACMKFMKKQILGKLIDINKVAYKEVNFKSKLIEWTQKHKVCLEFKLIETTNDKEGNPIFMFQVVLENIPCGEGKGYSKKESQQEAAKITYRKLRNDALFLEKIQEEKKKRIAREENKNTEREEKTTQQTPENNQNNTINEYKINQTITTYNTIQEDKESIIDAAETQAYKENL